MVNGDERDKILETFSQICDFAICKLFNTSPREPENFKKFQHRYVVKKPCWEKKFTIEQPFVELLSMHLLFTTTNIVQCSCGIDVRMSFPHASNVSFP